MLKKSNRFLFLIMLLLTLALAACGAQNEDGTETGATPVTTIDSPDVNNGGSENGGTAAATPTTDTANLPPLPALSPGGGGSGGGMGGGGGDTSAIDPESPAPMEGGDGMTMPIFIKNRLENAQFNLNTTLPGAPAPTTVWQQNLNEMAPEQMRDIANRLGFTGPLYTDSWYDQFVQDNPGVWPGPRSYYIFEGSRMLSFYGANISVYDSNAMPNSASWTLMPQDQARPIAEAYLNERGLLDFPYEVVPNPYGGQEIAFFRLVNGVRNTSAEISVAVAPNGNIVSLYIQPFSAFTAVGDYPLISAEEAWQLAQNTPDYLRVFHNIYTDPDTVPQIVDGPSSDYRYWARTYQNGESVTLYFYPTVYLSADGSSAPLVRAGEFTLIASEADLQTMVANSNQNIRLMGIVQGDTPYNQSIQVNSLEIIGDYQDWQSRQGFIRRADGLTYLDTTEGETIIIPGAPADLPDGTEVYVNGPIIEAGEPYGSFVWSGIDKVIVYTEEPVVMDPGLYPTPAPINQVNIDKVELVYNYSYTYLPDNSGPGQTWIQPTWRFTGTTETGELVELLVQAVAPEFLQPAG